MIKKNRAEANGIGIESFPSFDFV